MSFSRKYSLNTTFRRGHSGLLRVVSESKRRVQIFSWKKTNSVVKCRYYANASEKVRCSTTSSNPEPPIVFTNLVIGGTVVTLSATTSLQFRNPTLVWKMIINCEIWACACGCLFVQVTFVNNELSPKSTSASLDFSDDEKSKSKRAFREKWPTNLLPAFSCCFRLIGVLVSLGHAFQFTNRAPILKRDVWGGDTESIRPCRNLENLEGNVLVRVRVLEGRRVACRCTKTGFRSWAVLWEEWRTAIVTVCCRKKSVISSFMIPVVVVPQVVSTVFPSGVQNRGWHPHPMPSSMVNLPLLSPRGLERQFVARGWNTLTEYRSSFGYGISNGFLQTFVIVSPTPGAKCLEFSDWRLEWLQKKPPKVPFRQAPSGHCLGFPFHCWKARFLASSSFLSAKRANS